MEWNLGRSRCGALELGSSVAMVEGGDDDSSSRSYTEWGGYYDGKGGIVILGTETGRTS